MRCIRKASQELQRSTRLAKVLEVHCTAVCISFFSFFVMSPVLQGVSVLCGVVGGTGDGQLHEQRSRKGWGSSWI